MKAAWLEHTEDPKIFSVRSDQEVELKEGAYITPAKSSSLKRGDQKFYTRDYRITCENLIIYHLQELPVMSPGIWIGLTWWQNQRFLWMQRDHPLQKLDNYTKIISLILGASALINSIFHLVEVGK